MKETQELRMESHEETETLEKPQAEVKMELKPKNSQEVFIQRQIKQKREIGT